MPINMAVGVYDDIGEARIPLATLGKQHCK